MALTESRMVNLGSPCPKFSLKGVDNKRHALKDFAKSKALVVIFFANHCPYCQAMEDRIIQFNRDYAQKDVQVVAICSNDPVGYPDDSFENLVRRWHEKEYGFPYLWDEKQDVARAFGAVCTPDFFVYDQKRTLQYRGRFDDNWKEPEKAVQHDLPEAVDALLAGKTPSAEQLPSMGCSIKWRGTR